MSTCVIKFGGAAMASVHHFSQLAQIVKRRQAVFDRLIVVVSAMGQTTDGLMKLAHSIHPDPPGRELDMLVTAGERVSMSLLAMALDLEGVEAVSFTGSQAGIITTCAHTGAEILEVNPQRILEALSEKKVAIVAGFQGMSRRREITALGRGGADTSAVALAASLCADRVEFYKDVPGIGTNNPKDDPHTPIFSSLSYDEALEIVKEGAQVLHDQALKWAKKYAIPLEIRPFYKPEKVGTRVSTACQPDLQAHAGAASESCC